MNRELRRTLDSLGGAPATVGGTSSSAQQTPQAATDPIVLVDIVALHARIRAQVAIHVEKVAMSMRDREVGHGST